MAAEEHLQQRLQDESLFEDESLAVDRLKELLFRMQHVRISSEIIVLLEDILQLSLELQTSWHSRRRPARLLRLHGDFIDHLRLALHNVLDDIQRQQFQQSSRYRDQQHQFTTPYPGAVSPSGGAVHEYDIYPNLQHDWHPSGALTHLQVHHNSLDAQTIGQREHLRQPDVFSNQRRDLLPMDVQQREQIILSSLEGANRNLDERNVARGMETSGRTFKPIFPQHRPFSSRASVPENDNSQERRKLESEKYGSKMEQYEEESSRGELKSERSLPSKRPISVVCHEISGRLYPSENRVVCTCSSCINQPEESNRFTCAQFGIHAGNKDVRVWKETIQVKTRNGYESIKDWLRTHSLGKGNWRGMHRTDIRISPDATPQNDYARPGSSVFAQKSRYRQHEWDETPPFSREGLSKNTSRIDNKVGDLRNLRRTTRADADRSTSELSSKDVSDSKDVTKPSASKRGVEAKTAAMQQNSFSKPWEDGIRGNFSPVWTRFSGDHCAVCDDEHYHEDDQLVMCSQCGISVHQTCYGLSKVPDATESWICRSCEAQAAGDPVPQCCLCPVVGGALKPADIPGIWCHLTCVQWIPEVLVEDVDSMEPIRGLRSIPKDRWDLRCNLCRQRMGAKLQCESCFLAFHPLCARIARNKMEIQELKTSSKDTHVRLVLYCARHGKKSGERTGIRVMDMEVMSALPEPYESRGPALVDGQPFPKIPHASMPKLSDGSGGMVASARSMRIAPTRTERWIRRCDVVGLGGSTTWSFWMPVPNREKAINNSTNATINGCGKKEANTAVSDIGRERNICDVDETSKIDAALLPKCCFEDNHCLEPNCSCCDKAFNGQEESLMVRNKKRAYDDGPGGGGGADLASGEVGERKESELILLNEHDRSPNDGDASPDEGVTLLCSKKIKTTDAQPEEVSCVETHTMQHVDESSAVEPLNNVQDDALLLINRWCRVWWPEDKEWYLACIREFVPDASENLDEIKIDAIDNADETEDKAIAKHLQGPGNGVFKVWYELDGGSEWLDLCEEYQAGRLQILHGSDRQSWDPVPSHPPSHGIKKSDTNASSDINDIKNAADDESLSEMGNEQRLIEEERPGNAVGLRCCVSAEADGDATATKLGTILAYRQRTKRYLIMYDKFGVMDWIDLSSQNVLRILPEDAEGKDLATVATKEGDNAHLSSRRRGLRERRRSECVRGSIDTILGHIPREIPVSCGNLEGIFDLKRLVVMVRDSSNTIVEYSPAAFERAGGFAQARRWKRSIKVRRDKASGKEISMLSWMSEMGIDHAVFRTAHASATATRKVKNRQLYRKEDALTLEGNASTAAEKNEARRYSPGSTKEPKVVGLRRTPIKASNAMSQGRDAFTQECEQAMLQQASKLRWGKRAYVSVMPLFPTSGPVSSKSYAGKPMSRCWSPSEWVAYRRRQKSLVLHAKQEQAQEKPGGLSAGNTTLERKNNTTWKDGCVGYGLGTPICGCGLSDPVSLDWSLGGGQTTIVGDENLSAKISLGWNIAQERMSRKMGMKDCLHACVQRETKQLAIGKSGIHGWGLFARVPFTRDTMIAEFRGEIVRRAVAECRGRTYNLQNMDSYMFDLDAELVLDATKTGALARFIVRSKFSHTQSEFGESVLHVSLSMIREIALFF